MSPVRILVDSLADEGLPNAQMSNAREIIRRLDPDKFWVSTFCSGTPDPHIVARPNTEVIRLPASRQTPKILKQFLLGRHEILFYLKSAPASVMYMGMRQAVRDRKITIGTVESQCNLNCERTISKKTIRMWERTVLHCDYLFSNSSKVRDSLAGEYGLPSGIVPTGVDTDFFSPLERAANVRIRILFVGSLREFKQPQLLLDAALRFPSADFELAGDGTMCRELQNRIERENIGNAMLTGPQTAEQLRERYRRADIFLFPSQWEGSPKVILEAAACGLPVIARSDYRPESVLDGTTGFLVERDEDLFARLGELISNASLRREFGDAGRVHSQKFDWNPITRQWEEIFLHLLDRNGRPHA